MNSISLQIESILRERNSRVPQLEKIIQTCIPLHAPLENVSNILSDLEKQSTDNENLALACAKSKDMVEQYKQELKNIIEEAQTTKNRFSRNSINIGFAGTKGTGKSYLLQKLSGLTDNEVPSADGMPVTAVRCIIKNSPENKAHVLFYSESGFLENRVHPFCKDLGIPLPMSLDEFKKMSFPEKGNSEKEDIYIQKLNDYRNSSDQFEPFLYGQERIIELSDLRKFVSYTMSSDNSHGAQKIFYYLAVAKVDINCTFPRTDVKDLQLIDLPGLGELDPSLESRHTENFKDMVDLCLYIRRPSGTRMDWDQQAQKALETLTSSCPLARPSDFILIVLNAGGCKEDNAAIMEEDTRQKLGARYSIIKTSGQDSETLSSDILSKALHHLANKMPENDSLVYSKILEKHRTLIEKISNFANTAKRLLRQEGQGQDSEEIIRHAAQKAKRDFATISVKILNNLERKASGTEDPEELLQKLDSIENDLDYYFNNGMEFETKEEWHDNAVRRCAEDISTLKLQADSINMMRVHIAKSFSASLDTVYAKYIYDVQQDIVDAFNKPSVLNGLIEDQRPDLSLKKLIAYLDNSELPMPNMRKAINSFLSLKIEHNAQFYPRAYEPVRALKKAVSENAIHLEGTNNEEKVDSLYMFLADVGTRTVAEIKGKLVEEARIALFNILYVAYEMFDDDLIRSAQSEDEWIRLFKSYYEDISRNERKTNKSYLLNKSMKLLDTLRIQANQ